MAGQLIQVATSTVSGSSTNYVDLVGTTTDDVYMVVMNNATNTVDITNIQTRVLVSSSPDTTANYDQASKALRADTTFSNDVTTNQTIWRFVFTGTQVGERHSAIFYLYNFNSSSEYSFITNECVGRTNDANLYGLQGGGVHTVAQSCNGIRFFASSGNLADGSQFTLYKVV